MCKNNNLLRGHATNGIFIRGLVDGKRYTDIHTWGFLINIKKSYLEPTSTFDFGEMTLSFPKEKLLKVQNRCQEIRKLEKGKVTVSELSTLIGRLSSTAIALLPAPLHYRHHQHQQIQKLICHNSSKEKVEISVEARKELLWWKENLTLCNGRLQIISSPPQTRCIVTRLGSVLSGTDNRGTMVDGGTKVSHKFLGVQGS